MIENQNNSNAHGTGENSGNVEKPSRRVFLNSAGCAAMGGLAVAAGASLFTEKKAMASAEQKAPPLPWKYVKLDPLEAGKRGYKNYLLNGGWGSGAWLGVLSLLKEKVGYPYTTIPDSMFHHAAAGYAGQGTLCGSLGACSAIINLVAQDENKTHLKMIADLINWYASFNHPTDEFDAIVKFPKQKRVVPNSPLCHVSVSTWTMANEAEIHTKERKDRCAKVAGRVAMQTVMMLNDYADGKFKAVAPAVSAETASCLDCHGPEEDDNQQGQMNCNMCHPHTADHAE